MKPVIAVVWNLGEPFIHRVIKELYQRIGKEILKGKRRLRFRCGTVRYALAGPLPN
jgi:hypothetical protein